MSILADIKNDIDYGNTTTVQITNEQYINHFPPSASTYDSDYSKSVILDYTSDKPHLESSEPKDTSKRGNILLRTINDTKPLPKHHDLCLGFRDRDPRMWMSDPRFEKKRKHIECRKREITSMMKNNTDATIVDSPWMGITISKALRDLTKLRPKYTRIHSKQLGNLLPAKGTVLKSINSLFSITDQPMHRSKTHKSKSSKLPSRVDNTLSKVTISTNGIKNAVTNRNVVNKSLQKNLAVHDTIKSSSIEAVNKKITSLKLPNRQCSIADKQNTVSFSAVPRQWAVKSDRITLDANDKIYSNSTSQHFMSTAIPKLPQQMLSELTLPKDTILVNKQKRLGLSDSIMQGIYSVVDSVFNIDSNTSQMRPTIVPSNNIPIASKHSMGFTTDSMYTNTGKTLVPSNGNKVVNSVYDTPPTYSLPMLNKMGTNPSMHNPHIAEIDKQVWTESRFTNNKKVLQHDPHHFNDTIVEFNPTDRARPIRAAPIINRR